MKNIHILPTNESSRLHYSKVKSDDGISYKLVLNKELSKCNDGFSSGQRHVYITSDEEIKELDYIITKDGKLVEVSYLLSLDLEQASKVVLTTDPELIKDGVQVIPDEFLKWFVKNQSCEEVEVGKIKNYKGNYFDCFHTQGQCDCGLSPCKQMFFTYKIIIPKEEPKQECFVTKCMHLDAEIAYKSLPKKETLEESLKNELEYIHKSCRNFDFDSGFKTGGIIGAQWQQKFNDTSEVTRVEIIQHSEPYNGRAYTNYDAKEVEIQFQDRGKTLKIFLK